MGDLVTASCRETKEHLERVVAARQTVLVRLHQFLLDVEPTYINHWNPVKVPSMIILTGRPFHNPGNPILL
jgi:hypothetical protein